MTLSCPKCGNKTRKNGINKTTGLQKYRCNCGWSDSGAIYGVGRPSILGDRSLTNAERSRRKREKARKQISTLSQGFRSILGALKVIVPVASIVISPSTFISSTWVSRSYSIEVPSSKSTRRLFRLLIAGVSFVE